VNKHTYRKGLAMKAVGVKGQDDMTRLFDVEEPSAAHDGVVVEVIAASVNDFDRPAASGHYASAQASEDAVMLGRDFVGVVTAVGDDVDYIDVGLYVAAVLSPQALRQPGSFAERVAVPARALAAVPDGVDVEQAAAVGLAGVAAVDAISALGTAHLGKLVIHGPVNEIGGFALQLAKAHGAVVAAITPESQVELAWGLGADFVIPEGSTASESIEAVRDFFDGGVDTAIHVAGDLAVAAGVVRPGGKFTSVDGTVMETTPSADGYVRTIVAPSGHKLADLLFKVAGQRLISPVGRTLSFDQIESAVSLDVNNVNGRTVLIR
jgi:NADPH:quinone reductase-like Zn-dependent oxidoreductase